MADETTPQLSAEDFAAKVKAKYPDYKNVPDQNSPAEYYRNILNTHQV